MLRTDNLGRFVQVGDQFSECCCDDKCIPAIGRQVIADCSKTIEDLQVQYPASDGYNQWISSPMCLRARIYMCSFNVETGQLERGGFPLDINVQSDGAYALGRWCQFDDCQYDDGSAGLFPAAPRDRNCSGYHEVARNDRRPFRTHPENGEDTSKDCWDINPVLNTGGLVYTGFDKVVIIDGQLPKPFEFIDASSGCLPVPAGITDLLLRPALEKQIEPYLSTRLPDEATAEDFMVVVCAVFEAQKWAVRRVLEEWRGEYGGRVRWEYLDPSGYSCFARAILVQRGSAEETAWINANYDVDNQCPN